MSGIAGLIQFDGAPVGPGRVEKMTGAMASRGPDGIAHWIGGSAALGQCMLRTTPESVEETQPLVSEDEGLVLVMDGRVDNGEELRRDILGRGGLLRDRSDAELVLQAYATWGEQCPERIVGEFAFFIWDVRDRRLFGARDAAGTRHFYYHEGRGWFGFASEIKGLLALGRIEPRLNESRLLDYLVVEYGRDDVVGTFYQQIDRMPAGHAMSVTQRGARVWRYWEPGRLAANSFASSEECAEAFLEQFRIAVKCRLRSLGPVGTMLSGGLDSSSIAGLIRKEFRDELKQPLRTFSLIREDRENCTDWKYIQEMLKDGWFDPAIITSAAAGNGCDGYVEGIGNFDEPFAHCPGFVYSFVYDAARAGNCNVVLDGMAGDLLFYGPVHSMSEVVGRKMVSKIPAVLMAHRRHGIGRGLGAIARAILAEFSPDVLRNGYQKILDERGVAGFSKHETPGDNLRRLHRETGRRFLDAKRSGRRQAESGVKPGNDQSSHARRFASGLLSFAHEVYGEIALSRGVEPRSPFSDRRMIEFAIRMPVGNKLFAHWHKHLMRKSMAGVLPEEVRWRREVGRHPGWQFHERFMAKAIAGATGIWNFPRIASTLGNWIDPRSLSRARRQYEMNTDYETGYNLLALAVLARWMIARGLSTNCE